MFAAKSILAAVVCAGMGYASYPYVTLYRLDQAINTGNAAELRTLVDWPAVREGIKEDLCDAAADDPAQSGQLPAFGASFVRGIATNAVDQRVTPEGVVGMARRDHHGAGSHAAQPAVDWAFFSDPTNFEVSLSVPGESEAVRMRMTLKDTGWQVTRIWLPPAMLQGANART